MQAILLCTSVLIIQAQHADRFDVMMMGRRLALNWDFTNGHMLLCMHSFLRGPRIMEHAVSPL